MTDRPDLLERANLEFWRVIELAHREGLSYWKILRFIPDIITDLIIKAEIEYRIKGGK